MKLLTKYIFLLGGLVSICSCSVIEKSSMHGFESGYYTFKSDKSEIKQVYADLTDDKIDVYRIKENQIDNIMMTIPFLTSDSLFDHSIKFSERSLDIDISTILFKYRPSVYELPPQLITDFNVALFAGLRHDDYHIKVRKDPLGNYHNGIINRGYDFGIFAGPGTTLISPFTTQNSISDEYNGFIFQFGVAGFIESNVASFGIATGFDYLLSPDRKIWIYNKKPWVGFIIGIALN